jgi:glutathione S-transferase
MKLETWLRMANVPYEVAPLDLASAPKGKIPYIIEEDGSKMGDSTLIIEHLKSKHGRDLDAGLTAEQRAISLAFRRMMKESLYGVIVYSRYKDERNWGTYRNMLGGATEDQPPDPGRLAWADSYRKIIVDGLHGQGIGRHTQEEAYRIGIADVTAVSDYLGNKPFFMGEQVTLVDATVYAQLSNLMEVPIESTVKDFGLSRDNLVRYCQRMRERFFPELRASPARSARAP